MGELADAEASTVSELLDVVEVASKDDRKGLTLPWVSKTRVKLGSGDMPDEVHAVRSNLLYVSKENLSPAAINRLRRVAAFSNSDFYRA